jgi:hypothetical protein
MNVGLSPVYLGQAIARFIPIFSASCLAVPQKAHKQ